MPLYDSFDAAHQRKHVEMVIEQSMVISAELNVDMNMVYTIAAYHDTGLTVDHVAKGGIPTAPVTSHIHHSRRKFALLI